MYILGYIQCERILSRVLLPAPLRPMMPRISPSRTWKLASRRANSSPPTRLPWLVSPILSRGSGRPRALAHQSEVFAQGAAADEAEAVVFAEVFDLDDDGHEIR